MNAFLELPPERRRLAFQQVDESMGLQAFSVEKDFWVCWILREMFALPGVGEHLTFKGGTSLSKAWRLIQRFSEDMGALLMAGSTVVVAINAKLLRLPAQQLIGQPLKSK
jgi:predicted nucleotidyltransferase component of viral defense system